jgi:Uma2 family endonuclease
MPDDGNRYDIIGGELVVNPPPPAGHQRVFGQLLWLLDDYAQATGAGEVLPGPFDVVLGPHDAVQPDIIFLPASRPRIRGDATSIDFPPDLVVEILSPPSRGTDRARKVALSARSHVPEYWLADPDSHKLKINALVGNDYRAIDPDADGLFTSRVLPGLRVDPAEVFARLD